MHLISDALAVYVGKVDATTVSANIPVRHQNMLDLHCTEFQTKCMRCRTPIIAGCSRSFPRLICMLVYKHFVFETDIICHYIVSGEGYNTHSFQGLRRCQRGE